MFVKQPLIVVYILVGVLIGPHALELISDVDALEEVSEIGIVFLLFIVGLELPPNKLKALFTTTLPVTLLSALLFFVVGLGLGFLFQFSLIESCILGIAVTFSSTVLGVKLLPKSILHHRSIGEIVIGILLIQDIIAVISLVTLYTFSVVSGQEDPMQTMVNMVIGIPALIALAFIGPKLVIWPLLTRFDTYTEYLFLLYIGWCLAVAFTAHHFGFGLELGAFIAGVALANSPVSQSVAETLEPLRDFFLVLFFFSVGARVEPELVILPGVFLPAIVVACVFLVLKPVVFHLLLKLRKIRNPIGWEVGVRLGQCSEFSLLVLFVAATLMSQESDHVVLIATILTLLVSTYLVAFNYRGPFAIKDSMRVN